MSDIKIGSEWVQKQKKPKEFEIVVLSGDSLMVKENGEGFAIPWYTSDFLEHHEPKDKADMVNQPPHYKDASGIECCQVTDLMMFNAASCFKYLYRCGNKWDDIEDLKKAVWYAKRSYLTGDNDQPNSLEWDNNVKAIAGYREHGIYKAMTAIRSYSWLAVAAFIENEIARLEGRK